ncbi:hypothetical protein NC652_040020 [Populus alba x Populus x berolinensis]|nr:hypothetical protein NC652_040020 [Populus alba x Populus x berolinensis]
MGLIQELCVWDLFQEKLVLGLRDSCGTLVFLNFMCCNGSDIHRAFSSVEILAKWQAVINSCEIGYSSTLSLEEKHAAILVGVRGGPLRHSICSKTFIIIMVALPRFRAFGMNVLSRFLVMTCITRGAVRASSSGADELIRIVLFNISSLHKIHWRGEYNGPF